MGVIEKLKIENDLGLHARAAAKIVELVGQYGSSLSFIKGGREVDGSSILSILTLSCPKGTNIEVRIEGEDSGELLKALKQLFQDKFGEDK